MKSNVFLFTATLMLMVTIWTYKPYTPPTGEVEVAKDEVEGLQLFSREIFKDSDFAFLRADNFNDYIKYEVSGYGNTEELKAQLEQHLQQQGYEGDLLLMVVNPLDHEEVMEWL